jgi:heme A synthase
MPRFARFAWTLLAYDVAVVLWGAYVRATGSGAGCGRHWPLCNGEVLPRAARVETLVELSHRLSSGVVLVGTLALLVWAWRAYPPGHRVRKGAAWTSVFAASEAAIGAALVLFELVAHDASMKRALSVCMHLVNTFLLLASTALTAWWGSGGAPLRVGRRRALAWILGVPAGLLVVVGASGAVTALGDTLFPPPSLAAGLAQDVAPGAHAFVRLRGLHPMLAALTAATIVISASAVRALQPTPAVRLLSRGLAVLAIAQVAAGLLDVATLAPVALQLVHLALADAVWIALVLTAAAALGEAPAPDQPAVPRSPRGPYPAIRSRNGPAPTSDVPPSTSSVEPVT